MSAVLDVVSDILLGLFDAIFARKTDERSGKGKRHDDKR